MVFAYVTSENSHSAHTCWQCKECLIHCRHYNRAVNLWKIGFEVKRHSLSCAFQQQTVYRQNYHQHKQCAHHIFCYFFKSVLNIERKNYKSNNYRNQQKNNIYRRLRNHRIKAEVGIIPYKKIDKIVDNPSAHNCVKRHQRKVAQKANPTESAPFLPRLF